ncbi:uncharacterized protein LOC130756444 isoform X2 [Actinidia eriantha]|uniref:uncharacterized protein LOC130756444 isoform X2 n=1 Tax=Actinidia eriantha TaxID=165200 RepID=UPI0025892CD4|nr:uncharacterized protein LOC130756444 isoform X2 [Actinidia eriantha]
MLWPSLDRDEGNDVMRYSALSYVVHQLTRDKIEYCAAKMGNEDCTYEAPNSLMLMSSSVFVQRSPTLVMMDSDIRAECVQVFFSAVYHLKSAILPYCSVHLKVSLKSIGEGSAKLFLLVRINHHHLYLLACVTFVHPIIETGVGTSRARFQPRSGDCGCTYKHLHKTRSCIVSGGNFD